MEDAIIKGQIPIDKSLIKDNEETIKLPTIALLGICAFPNHIIKFDVGRKKSVDALNKAIGEKINIFVATQSDNENEASVDNISKVGVILNIKQFIRVPNGSLRLIGFGLKRARVISYSENNGIIYAELKTDEVTYEDSNENFVLLETCKNTLKSLMSATHLSFEVGENPLDETNAERFCNTIGVSVLKNTKDKQQLLELNSTTEKLEFVLMQLVTLQDRAELEKKILSKVRANMEDGQREYFMREQIKVLHETLGDDVSELENYKQAINGLKISEEFSSRLLKEVERLSKTPISSPENVMLKNYLDWITDLPFDKKSVDRKDFQGAEDILNQDHYGLEDVKKRILEYIAVYKLTKKLKAPILCFVGPPGVGKTSIATSIARALNKKFVRMSLGGVKDESEIRGHRRTYIGSMPGRIIYNIKNAGVCNPVFLLDEIDKMSCDYRGDPASAMLEVLDPEQNSNFRDNYIEIPFDLSNVMFIATANTTSTIPPALLDRMELIEINGYTDEEKLQIAKRYLVPKSKNNNGLKGISLSILDETLLQLIDCYTSEAGVRGLEKEINSICRKYATKHATTKISAPVIIKKEQLIELLGVPKYKRDFINKTDEVGVVTGLAWTSVGGTVLPIEVITMPGSGEVILTGQLGDVMKESAKTALGYIKAHTSQCGIENIDFSEIDIHIHAPEGAVPKDGPSAGITMATAILSALTGKKVKHSIAMTGEITLRGIVLAIGGLKEKCLAGLREGIKTIIIPKENECDIKELPKTVTDKVKIIAVENVSQVFEKVFTE